MAAWLEDSRKYLHYHALIVWRTKDFWLRAVLCWIIGAVLLVNDEVANFDMRFKIRGPRPSPASIVIVDVSERDWSSLDSERRNTLRHWKEISALNDSFFWNPGRWEKLLFRVLSDAPASVGVTFFFGENVRAPAVPSGARAIFDDPRIVWGADVDSSDRVLIPAFASTYNGNVGLRVVRPDDDGTVRRFASSPAPVPNLAARLAEIADPQLMTATGRKYQAQTLINYSGGAASFEIVNAKEVIEGRVPPGVFNGKIVIVGSTQNPADLMQTPLGRMSRAEILANITENIVLQKTVKRGPTTVYLVILALFIAASVWVLVTYPQSVTLVMFFLAAIAWASASAWAFDILYLWIPVLSPTAQLILTCIVFLSYQLALNERRTWRLQQEQRYLSEIEQLKTNFVSMMSHDLKTPIAKIQAICDRLLAQEPAEGIIQDLKSLRRSSDELHRYIQSILQVTKVEAKDFRIQKEVIDINENIERVVARLQPLAAEKSIAIEVTLEPMFSIEADGTLIQEVILNLMENAIKYTPAGGRVQVRSEEKDDNVIVVVEDTGPGIDPEDQKEIWGKFTRGRSASLETKGTGLGLYLVKFFIELHGGRVFLESELGKGTKVGFSIPIADETATLESETGEGSVMSPLPA